jgi:hypothetical protein
VKGEGVPKDASRAYELYAGACTLGSATACYRQALHLHDGVGVAKDQALGMSLLAKTCEGMKHADACALLGALAMKSKDWAKAASRMQVACDAGSVTGCLTRGMLHDQGKGGAKDPAAAAQLYAKLCDQGESSGCALLGLLHVAGSGVRKDVAKGHTLIDKVCAKDPDKCMEVAMMYANGTEVVERDRARAKVLLDRACKAGREQACRKLVVLNALTP